MINASVGKGGLDNSSTSLIRYTRDQKGWCGVIPIGWHRTSIWQMQAQEKQTCTLSRIKSWSLPIESTREVVDVMLHLSTLELTCICLIQAFSHNSPHAYNGTRYIFYTNSRMKDHILFQLLQNENKTKGRPDTIIHGGGNINIIFFYLFSCCKLAWEMQVGKLLTMIRYR